MSRRLSVLSPRRAPSEFEDWATPSPLIAGQRVDRQRQRRRIVRGARRLGRIAGRLALGGAVLALAALGVVWLCSAPRFAVAEIEVAGHSRLSREEIVAASGIRPGVNLFRLDARAAVTRVEALAPVRRAELIRRFPNRVTFVVEERRPFTLVHAGHLHWIDEQGVAVSRESRAVPVALPVISGLTAEELATARQAPSARVASGVSLIRLLLRSGSQLTIQISEIDVSRPEGPVLYTVEGVEVRLGAEEWEARLPRLQGVLAQLASSGQSVTSIDLRFRDQVVLKTPGK